MQPRRALVLAGVDGAAVASAAAALSVQLRSHTQATAVTLAPKRRSSAQSKKSSATAKKVTAPVEKPANVLTPALPSQRLTSVDQEAIVEDNKYPMTSPAAATAGEADVDAAVSAVAEDDAVSLQMPTATGAEESKGEEHVTTVLEMQDDDADAATAAAATTATTATELDALDEARQRRRERKGITALQRRLLVGAYAALESTPDCPDPRTRALRLKTQRLFTEAEEAKLVAEVAASDSARATTATVKTAMLSVEHPLTAQTKTRQELAASVPLPLEESIRIFASTFAVTLHASAPRWRYVATTSTAPAVRAANLTHTATSNESEEDLSAEASSSSSSPSSEAAAAAASALSFLASPFSISASHALSTDSPHVKAAALEAMAPIQWLETSFEQLCQRVALDIQHELQQTPSRSVAHVCSVVRTHASALLSAVEQEAISAGSRQLFGMQRQFKRQVAAAAAARKRRSSRPSTSTTDVRDTLLNTVDRVAMELHLVHVLLTRLCEKTPAPLTGVGSSSGAACVETVVQQAYSWGSLSNAAPSAAQVQWMLATAVLERVHVQTYHFHHSTLSTTTSLQDLTTAAAASAAAPEKAGHPTYQVDEKRLAGLAALVEFALTERGAFTLADIAARQENSVHHQQASPITSLDEGLFVLLAALHAVLPSYAVLLPAWQRVVASSPSASSFPAESSAFAPPAAAHAHLTRSDRGSSGEAATLLEEELNNGISVEGQKKHAEATDAAGRTHRRDSILAASPTAVWDVVAGHWSLQEERVRQEGGLAALWWLRLLPLWVSTTTSALQLRLVTAALSTIAEADEALFAETAGTASGTQPPTNDAESALQQLVRQDVTDSLEGLLHKSSELLRDTLRFDRVRYERSLVPSSRGAHRDPAADANKLNGVTVDEKGETGAEGDAAAATLDSGSADADGHSDETQNVDGDVFGEDSGEAPPPLQRNRGKRSLFYKPADGTGNTILQDGEAATPAYSQRNGGNSRFVSRTRGSGGGGASSASSSANGTHHHHHHHRHAMHVSASASASAHEHTSALFDVMVLSTETPILLSHRFALTGYPQRSSVVEETWAAAAQAKSELWRVLYALPSATTVAAAATRHREGGVSATHVLRSVLPSAVLSLLPSAVVSVTSHDEGDHNPDTSKQGNKAKGKAAKAVAPVTNAGTLEECMLRRVTSVMQSAQALFGLTLFESLDHVLVAVAHSLLRIQHAALSQVTASLPLPRQGSTATPRRPTKPLFVHASKMLTSMLTVGATTLVADNPLSLAGLSAEWQQWQLRFHPAVTSPLFATSGPVAVADSAAMHAFASQWTSTLMEELPFFAVRCRQHPDVILANVREILRVLRTPAMAGALPLFARQVSFAALLRGVHALSAAWRHAQDKTLRRQAGPSDVPFTIPHEVVERLYEGMLEALVADNDARLVCCNAVFIGMLYEAHDNLLLDRAVLNTWTNAHLLPLVLPVVVAGLHRSRLAHNTATHADLCETTLALLSALSRCSTNAYNATEKMVRLPWHQTLLQVALYCIRVAGRGGAKQAADFGLPLVTLPDLAKVMHAPASPALQGQWFAATFAHGGEAVFLSMLDRGNNLMSAKFSVHSRDVDAANGIRAALTAFVDAWKDQVRFGRRDWEAMMPFEADGPSALHGGGGNAAVPMQTLLSQLQASCAAVQAFRAATQPAFTASAEAIPFIASRPGKAHQLGFLVRFTEHFLRGQEKTVKMQYNDLPLLRHAGNTSTPDDDSAVPADATTTATAATATTAEVVPLSDAAPLVLLEFVGHLTSAGGWSMVMWACNLAETVIGIELRRHRRLPEAARTAATTAILSQLRAVPAPQIQQLRSFKVKALLNISDAVDNSPKSLLGFGRQSPFRGLLSHPTRDQYRVLIFGVKQAMAYVLMGSRNFRASRAENVGAADDDDDADSADAFDGHQHDTLFSDVPVTSPAELREMREMSRKSGAFYAAAWHHHLHAPESSNAQPHASVAMRTSRGSRSDYTHHLVCLVILVDAFMELAQLYLLRQQGDGEEDIRRVLEAGVVELCRTVSATIQSVLALTVQQRQECFHREQSQLLWASLCILATIGTVAPLDTKERFYTPRCTQAIRAAVDATAQLLRSVLGENINSGDDDAVKGKTEEEEKEEEEEGRDARQRPSSTPPPAGDTRPLCAALVRGVQGFLRDTPTTHRIAIRLALKEHSRDDLPAALSGFHVLCMSARAYEPTCALLTTVWERVAEELMQPFPETSMPASRSKKKKKISATRAQSAGGELPLDALRVLVATVPSRSEYATVLRDFAGARSQLAKAPSSHVLKLESGVAGTSSFESRKGVHEAAAANTKKHPDVAFNPAAAVALVAEDAAAVRQERQFYMQHVSPLKSEPRESENGSLSFFDAFSGSSSYHNALASTALSPDGAPLAAAAARIRVATELENGTMSLAEILNVVIAHTGALLVAAGRRSSFDTGVADASSNIDGDGNMAAVGSSDFMQLVQAYYQDMMDLLLHVPLRAIVTHPHVEKLFDALTLVEECLPPDMEAELWQLLTQKWTEEYITPAEEPFLKWQAAQLALVRTTRGVHVATHVNAADENGQSTSPLHVSGGAPNTGSSAAPPTDMLARTTASANTTTTTNTSAAAAARSTGAATFAISISAAAQESMRQHWYGEMPGLPHHDDGRHLVGDGLRPAAGHNTAASDHRSKGKGKKSASRRQQNPQQQQQLEGVTGPSEAFPGELDREATGAAALAAMPDPIPLPVVLSVMFSLSRRRGRRATAAAASQVHARASWVGAGGDSAKEAPAAGDDDDLDAGHKGTPAQAKAACAAAFREFVEAVLTYTSRTFWLLRPRLDDNAWMAWAVVERSMSVYPAANNVRQQVWATLCNRWRVTTSLEGAKAVAGQLFTAAERRRVVAWLSLVNGVCPSHGLVYPFVVSPGNEEVAVYSYVRAMALYLQLLSLSMSLANRNHFFGDLVDASADVVRRRVQLQLQRRSGNGSGSGDDSSHAGLVRETTRHELRLLEQDRQTRPEMVNRNVFEGATLQFLNVSWCLLRHADSLTHMATDTVIDRLISVSDVAQEHRHSMATSTSAIATFAEQVQELAVGSVQDTLLSVLYDSDAVFGHLAARVSQTLLTSGFSCEQLYLRVPSHLSRAAKGNPGHVAGGTAPAAAVVATLLNAVAAPSASAINPVARAELFVGSPTMLAVLTPHFVKKMVSTNCHQDAVAVALLPIISALDFYLSRGNVPLSPLLEAITELLTSTPIRNSAVHTFCERLAGELTARKEFRQALAPPTIASVEQGAAGSISNEIVICFVAAIARDDVHVTKKTLGLLLHTIMSMRPDVFGQPPTVNRQGKLTLVQVGTTVETTIDTTNPLYTPKQPRLESAVADATAASAAESEDEAAMVLKAFSVDKWTDFTAMTHRKALAALTISLPTIMEVAMHMDAMRELDYGERQRALQMLKAADDARRERMAMHRSQAQVAVTGQRGGASSRTSTEAVGKLDASLHLEDPLDFGVAMLHLRYALRKVVHACLRRLLHQQGPRSLADVAMMLEMVDPGLRPRPGAPHGSAAAAAGAKPPSTEREAMTSAAHRAGPYDGVLAGTMRVLLSRAVLCAQAIGYDGNGAPLELPPRAVINTSATESSTAATVMEGNDTQPILKLPVPALQASVVEAAIVAQSSSKGRHHAPVGNSSGKIGQLTKEEKAAVHQRVELEREAATTVGQSAMWMPRRDNDRVYRALRFTRIQRRQRQKRRDNARRRSANRSSSASGASSALSMAGAPASFAASRVASSSRRR